MTKFKVLVVLAFLSTSPCLFAASKAFEFVSTVIESLGYCEWADHYMSPKNAKGYYEDSTALTEERLNTFSLNRYENFYTANKKLDSAILLMKKYLSYKDNNIAITAKGIIASASILKMGNDETMKQLSKVLKKEYDNPNDIGMAIAKINADNKEAWMMLWQVSDMCIFIVTKPPATGNRGPISFTITPDERKGLINQIESRFKDNIKTLYDAKRANLNGADEGYNVVSLAVDRIRRNLVKEMYEEEDLWDSLGKKAAVE